MNDDPVGKLVKATSGQLRFEYDDSWMGNRSGRPISMSMPLSDKVYSGSVVENYFENLLPDNVSIRNRIQAKFRAATNSGFDLLWHVGADCVGAIQIVPEGAIPSDVRSVQAIPLTDTEIATTLKNYKTLPLGMNLNDDFRISIAGAQEKTALLLHEGRWCRPVGATPTSHIFKLPIGKIAHSGMDLTESVENEWVCHLILREFGLPVAKTDIAVFEDMKVLSVERFDRRWSEDHSWLIRLPQEDMCQALNIPPAAKYESDGGPGIVQIMDFLLASSSTREDRYRFMKTLVLFYLLGAIDGHAKNFSIFLRPAGNYSLTPSYDVMSAYPLVAKNQLHTKQLKMAMAVRGNNKHYAWDHILLRHWFSSAKACHFDTDEMESIVNEVFDLKDRVKQKVVEIAETKLTSDQMNEVVYSIFGFMEIALGRLK